jgi:hypothetical protein
MTALIHDTAPTLFVQAGGIRFAYRRLGRKGDVPLLLLNYLAANMDVAISYLCPILQQLMSKLMSRRTPEQRIHGLAQKVLKI